MNGPASFFWHDYETFGADPARDRPSQFAGRRTDAELNPIGEPLVVYCQPILDVLPHPDACLITGITPQQARAKGVPEPEFARQILEAFSQPGTCAAGYNSIRFDDEVSRNLFYRNFHDPYQREWFGGNSRWDLIDVMRLWHALRPEGLVWPRREDGTATSFKLGDLSSANGIVHEHAHDALSDVDATIGLARALRKAQPRLFEHALKLRDKKFAATLFNLRELTPVLHVSSKIPATRGCIAVIAPLAMHPTNNNQVITYDLSADPTELLELEEDEIYDRVFTSEADLPEGLSRIPLKGVHLNKSPMLAPMSTLNPEQAERWGIDLKRCEEHRAILLRVREALAEKVRTVFSAPEYEERDPELSLYGGFLPDGDKPRLQRVRDAAPESLAQFQGMFGDARYNELLFRYRARHYPKTLNADEQIQWKEFVERKLNFDTGLASLTLEHYQDLVAAYQAQETDPARRQILDALTEWPQESGLQDFLKN